MRFAAATASTTPASRSISSSACRCSGFQANLLAPNLTNGIAPALPSRPGVPADRSCARRRSSIRRSANGGDVLAVPPDGLTLPRFQNWSVTFQRQLTDNMMLDVSYIGNRGTRLNHHFQTLGVDANMNDPSVLALGTAVLQSNINSPLAQQAGIRSPYPGFNGNVAQALRKYPQYQTIQWRGVPTGGASTTRSRRCWSGASRAACRRAFAYTYSKLSNNGAESAQGAEGINGTVQNPAIRSSGA